MIRLFLVAEGCFLSAVGNVLPTARVEELYGSIVKELGVGVAGKMVLLAPGGRQLQRQEVIASYGAGTEERPVFVFFKQPCLHQHGDVRVVSSGLRHVEHQVQLLSASPSTTSLQKQVHLAEAISQDARKLSAGCHQLVQELHLQRAGWESALTNTMTIMRAFQKHFKAFSRILQSQSEMGPSYKSLLDSFSKQVEVLKKIPLPPMLGQSVFSGPHNSLYEWISAQDDHSSLSQLRKECQEALSQADEAGLSHLKASAEELSESAEGLLHQCRMRAAALPTEEVESKVTKIVEDLFAVAESIQGTVRRARSSGDAGVLADICLSNVKLLQLMSDSYRQLQHQAELLQDRKSSQSSEVVAGLQALTSLQQEIGEMDPKLLLYYEHLQLTRRRFEILEQICAAPSVLGQVLDEVRVRRNFKELFIEEGHRVVAHFQHLRETEKARRQAFMESCSQHFLLSLFPSLMDKPPRFPGPVPERFDEELCNIPEEQLASMVQSLHEERVSSCQQLNTLLELRRNTATQTDTPSEYCQEKVLHVEEVSSQTVDTALTGGERESLVVERDQLQQQLQQVTMESQQQRQQLLESQKELQQLRESCRELEQLRREDLKQFRESQSELQLRESTGQQQVEELRMEKEELQDQMKELREELMAGSQRNCEQLSSEEQHQLEQLRRQQEHMAERHQRQLEELRDRHQEILEQLSKENQKLQEQLEECDQQLGQFRQDKQLLEVEVMSFKQQIMKTSVEKEQLEALLESERDNHMKQSMELERELKEIQHLYENPASLKKPAAAAVTPDDRLVVSVDNLQVGDTALFMQDNHLNLLALTVDHRIYYLNHICADELTDLSSKVYLPLKRKLVLGRITEKVLVEVRKEANRLKVPVGHRLYKMTAEEVPVT